MSLSQLLFHPRSSPFPLERFPLLSSHCHSNHYVLRTTKSDGIHVRCLLALGTCSTGHCQRTVKSLFSSAEYCGAWSWDPDWRDGRNEWMEWRKNRHTDTYRNGELEMYQQQQPGKPFSLLDIWIKDAELFIQLDKGVGMGWSFWYTAGKGDRLVLLSSASLQGSSLRWQSRRKTLWLMVNCW